MATGSNDIKQFNVAKSNMLTTPDYNVDTDRLNGFTQGIARSIAMNKVLYQVSTMCAALGEAMASKGYVISDTNIQTLISVLANIMTEADMSAYCTTPEMTTYVQNYVIPVGGVIFTFDDVVPSGYLELNGASLSRASYPNLYAKYGIKYGAVDGVHFNLPDMRGYFPRGWDHGRGIDPDKTSRANRGDGTAGDQVGTKQDHQIMMHRHSLTAAYTAYRSAQTGGDDWCAPAGGIYTNYEGGNETRPVNINVMFCVKY